jgi:DNA-binding CsgD family transcriptional regulator
MSDQLEKELNDLPPPASRWVFSGFPGAWEKEFYAVTLDHFPLGLIRFTLAWGFTLMAGFGIINNWMLPPDNHIPWLTTFTIVRLAVICPYILFCFISSFFRYFKRIAYPALCLSALITAAGVCGRIALSTQTDPAYSLYYVGLILVCIGLNTGFHMRFIYAALIGGLILIMYGIATFFFNNILSSSRGTAIFLNNVFFLVATEIMGLLACFFGEYYSRKAFLLQKKIFYVEELNKLKAIENWKEAYRIYKEIDSELFRKNLKKTLRIGEKEKHPVEEYIKKLKTDQASSGVLNLIRTVGSSIADDDLFEKIMDIALKMSGARRGCIIIRNEKSGELEFIVRRNLDKTAMRLPLAVAYDALNSGKTITFKDVPRTTDFPHRHSALECGVRSLLCFPVEYNGEAIGACYLDSDVSDSVFSKETCEMLVFLITQVVLSFKDAAWRGKYREIVIDEAHFNVECEKYDFTEREKQILLLVLKGFSNKAICDKSFISMNTLRTHLKKIYGKAEVAAREELIDVFAKYEIV